VAQLSVSVALATFNGAGYLRDQLADLAAQSRPPDEVVICDDTSSDKTISIAREFAASAPFPVSIHQNPARLGYRENFVRSAERCTSDLIAFCDQDDRWPDHKLATACACFEDPSVLLVFHNARVITDDGSPVSTLYPDSMKARQWTPLSGSPWRFSLGFTQIFRRSLLRFDDLWEKSRDENAELERLAHDQWYFFLASVLGCVRYLPACLADYRQHRQNIYGWRRFAPTIRSLVQDRVSDAGHSIARRAAAAQSRADILSEIASRVANPEKGRAIEGADAYRKFAERCWLRAAIYEPGSFARRSAAFWKLVRRRGYGSDPWKFGPFGLAMDFVVGLSGFRPAYEKRLSDSTDQMDPGKIA
jgi:rhamnosyltransferase